MSEKTDNATLATRKLELQGRMVFHNRMGKWLNAANQTNVVMVKARPGYKQELDAQIKFHREQTAVTKAELEAWRGEFEMAGLG